MATLKQSSVSSHQLHPSHSFPDDIANPKKPWRISLSFSSPSPPLLVGNRRENSPNLQIPTAFLIQKNTATFFNRNRNKEVLQFSCFDSCFSLPLFSQLPCRPRSILTERIDIERCFSNCHCHQFSKKSTSQRLSPNPCMAIQKQTEGTACKLVFSFPHIPTAGQETMASVLSFLEDEIGHDLMPSQTSEDVINLRSPNGNAEGSVRLWAGKDRSYIDRVLISSLHCELPHVTLDFATLVVLMGNGTDAPDFLLEFPFSGKSKMTMVLDLLPRKDLALHVDYLKRIYEKSTLPALYMQCEQDTRLRPYVPPSLYIRSVTSPTSLLYTLDATEDGSLDEAIREIVRPTTEKVVADWIHAVKHRSVTIEDDMERQKLSERDDIVRANGIEEDLTGNLPRLFGEEATIAVLEAFRKGV